MSFLSRPSRAQAISIASAPNAQRQKTTVAGGCPSSITGQPTVPEMTMARVICNTPPVLIFICFLPASALAAVGGYH
jgi:hypothetical protein